MSAPIISSCSWLSLTTLSFCHKNAAVAADSGILKHKHRGEMCRSTCCCEGLTLNLSRDNFCPALATPLESRTVRRSGVVSAGTQRRTHRRTPDTIPDRPPDRPTDRPYRVNRVYTVCVSIANKELL
jgi:hypothetical protein